MLKLMDRSWIGAGGDAATLKFPLGLEVTYYDRGQWGTVYLGRLARICWTWKKAVPGRRPASHEIYLSTNSTPWGIPRLLGRVLYVGKVGKRLRVFPDADEYAQWRYLRPYVVMRGWVKWPDSEDDD